MKNTSKLNAKMIAFIFLLFTLAVGIFSFARNSFFAPSPKGNSTENATYQPSAKENFAKDAFLSSEAYSAEKTTLISIDSRSKFDENIRAYILIITTKLTHNQNNQGDYSCYNKGNILATIGGQEAYPSCFLCYNNKIGICFFTTPPKGTTVVFSGSFIYDDTTYFINPFTIISDGTNFYQDKAADFVITFNIGGEITNEKITSEKYEFKSLKNIPNKVILGYTVENKFYFIGENIVVIKDLTATATIIDFYMEKGASVRLDEINSGLRFTSYLSATAREDMRPLGAVEFGTIIIPTKDIQNTAFELKNFNIGQTIVDIPAKNYIVKDGQIKFSGVLTSVRSGNYNKNFSARAYVKIENNGKVNYIYSNYVEEENSRSIYEISKKAINDKINYDSLTAANKQVLKNFVSAVVEINYVNGVVTLPQDRINNYELGFYGKTLAELSVNITFLEPTKVTCATFNGKRKIAGGVSGQGGEPILNKTYLKGATLTIKFKL